MPVEIRMVDALPKETDNITEPKPAHEGLRTSEIRYRRLFESARDGILILDAVTLRITDVNPFMTELLGYSRDEFLGKELWEIGLFSDKEASQQAFRELQAKGYLRYEDLPLQTTDGKLREVEFVSNLYEEDRHQVIQCNIRDITDRKRAEEERGLLLESAQAARAEADAANGLKDEFLATLSHELRTPLTAILGWSHLLIEGKLDEQQCQRAIETIGRNARAQRQLIDDLLDISRIITGKLRLDVSPVELAPMIAAVVDGVRPAADARNIRLRTGLDLRISPIAGDPDRLQQIVWNLLSNAIKFTPKGGDVYVRLEQSFSHIEITISDTGQGIAPELLVHVFDRFRQADSSLTRRHGGLGLGLSIVRQLVELHGGTVTAESPGAGGGTTFKVMLPVRTVDHKPSDLEKTRAMTGNKPPSDRQPSLSDLLVLIVDDEQDARELVAAVLMGRGAEVVAVGSALEALAEMERQRFDVLVSDIGMPVMDGYALISAIRQLPAERGGRIPAAALTAYAGVEDRVRVLSAGYQMHIPKPVEPAELTTVVLSLGEWYAVPVAI
ncbi:MAG TPA: ATP-binding protein [Pyrinomonadaceae bacterium]|nr:ATP-binding protein [Pyrinomonadaceae bacterium]